MREVVIVSAARTAIGSFGGSLAGLSAVELGASAAREAIRRAGVEAGTIDELVVGNVLCGGLGQNVARQIAIKAGLPVETPAAGISKVCGSGLRAVSLAAQMIRSGDADAVLAGGTESMSNAPYVLHKSRWGYRMGDEKVLDSMIHDGLWDAFNDYHMGVTAENVADKFGITRDMQDEFAWKSQQKAQRAIEAGTLREEIVPLEVRQKKQTVTFDTDEFPRFHSTPEGLASLKPAFRDGGTVTAGNSSGINDGAAMLVIMAADKAEALGLRPLAFIRAYASAGLDPAIMGYGVAPAIRKTLDKAGIRMGDIGLAEINEAFAAQAIAVTRDLGIPTEITNVNGGAISLGHPIGASGARILVTLLYEMRRRNIRYGLAGLCIGGGMGTAMLVEGAQCTDSL